MNNIDSQLSMPDFFSMFGSFILVLLLLGLVLFILKKIQMKSSVSNGGRKIQIIEVMPTSNKQKIMLLKVENQQFLVGVSGQNLNQLGHWSASEPMPEKEKDGFNDYRSDSETGMNNNTHQKKPISNGALWMTRVEPSIKLINSSAISSNEGLSSKSSFVIP